MADKVTLYAKLRRLFSSNVVVRNVGGKKLRVMDMSAKQMYPKKLSRDRFSRIHTQVPYGTSRSDRFAYQAVRIELFRDYDAMDADPIIASALDIYADESTTKNEYGNILTVKTNNLQIKDLLENLFYDILNIEFNLWPWVRNMCKYGDCFLYLDINDEYGITNVIPLSVYATERIEGDEEGLNPHLVTFKIDQAFSTYRSSKEEFENFEIAHFRLLSDSNFLPYGKALVENGRRVWKQLVLLEDAMMIHRITRAPEKRIFKIDIGNIPPQEVELFMNKTIEKMKKAILIDPQTGEYNLRYNVQNMLEDYYLPVRGGDSGTSIDTAPGLTYESIDDVEYLKSKLLAALKVPKAFLGYEEGVEGKATLAAEDVRFARTIERIQRIIVSELTKIAIVHLYIQGFRDASLVDFSLELTNPSTIYEQEKVNLWSEKLTLSKDMLESRLISSNWIYENIFDMSKEEYKVERELVIEDLKRQFRHVQILDAGNDPARSGQKEELDVQAGEAGGGMDSEGDGPGGAYEHVNYDDEAFKRGGRPKEPGNRGQDKNAFGRDPIGKKSKSTAKAGSSDRKRSHDYRGGSPLSFEQLEKTLKRLDDTIKKKTNGGVLLENNDDDTE